MLVVGLFLLFILCVDLSHFLSWISGSVKVLSMNETLDSLIVVRHFSLKNVKEYVQGRVFVVVVFNLLGASQHFFSSSAVAGSVGKVTSLEWTSDGINLAVGWSDSGFAVWNLFGRLTSCSITDIDLLPRFSP